MQFKIIIILSFILTSFYFKAQDRFDLLEQKLDQVAKSYPGMNDKVELSMNGASIQEYIRAIGTNNNLNVNVNWRVMK